ncbi:hypothetical protein DJ480_20015 [Pseudomonas sp. Leaf98]|nr:hypothetical protein DJ480_20015 [Pseudomonas sp. Leaf98]
MGAGLPAMQAPRCICDTEVMLSQASQLPQLIAFQAGYWLVSRPSRTSNPKPHAPVARHGVRTW